MKARAWAGAFVVLGLVAAAHAAPPVDKGSGIGQGRVRFEVHPVFKSRMTQKVRSKNGGAEMTAQEALDKFDDGDKLDLDDGTKLSVKELLADAADAETQVAQRGASLSHLKKTGWARPTTQAKIAAQRSLIATEMSSLKSAKTIPKMDTLTGCTPATCVPADKDNSVRWDKQKGDEDIAAVYSSFTAGESTPDAQTAKCTAAWDNGVYLFGEKHSLVKFTADSGGSAKSATWSGKAALYVLGQASPTFSREGKVTDSLDRTFKTAKAKLSYSFIPLVSVEGSIEASATLGLKPNVDGGGSSAGVQCKLAFTPRLAATVNPEVKIIVGHKKLAKLAEGGVKANLTVIDLQLPTEVNANIVQNPMAFDLAFRSDLDTTFLKGRVWAWYKIKDICKWGVCLLEDILNISTHGEINLWEDADGIPMKSNLIDLRGRMPLKKTMTTMTLSQ